VHEATSRRRSIDELLRDARARLDRLSPGQARAATCEGGLIVDIRSEVQRSDQGLVPGALFVPRNVLEWRADPRCPHHDPRLGAVSGPLVLMCAQGFQSSLAAATLQDLGLRRPRLESADHVGRAAEGLPVVAQTS